MERIVSERARLGGGAFLLSPSPLAPLFLASESLVVVRGEQRGFQGFAARGGGGCLLYTSDAADE